MFDYDFMMRHITEGLSIRQLAKEADVHHNKLRRAMIKAGIKITSPGESLSKTIKAGLAKTRKGAKLTEEHRLIIAKANKGKKREVQTKNNFIMKKQDVARSAGARGNLKAAKKGSKFERMLLDKLTENGYNVIQQYAVEKYKVDLFLPDFKLAVEIDGIFHREPIHGVDRLQASIEKDRNKDECLKQKGIHLLRVVDNQKGAGVLNCHIVCEEIKRAIEESKKVVYLRKSIEIN